jgi:hypothetical protein
MLGKNLLEYNTETIDGYGGSRIYHSGDVVSDVYESTGQRHFYKGDTATNLRGDVASESIDDFMSRRGLPSAGVAFDNANKVAAPAYQTTDDLIKDFTTKASSSQADEAGTILKDIFDKTDFANKQFDIPGSTRLVTGSDVLGKLSGIEMTDQIGSVAAYNPERGMMQVNPNLLGYLQPEEIATTFTHELFHTAADASGAMDAERITRATSARSAMTLEDAKYLGEQEGIADSFSRRINKRSWSYTGD